MDPLRVFFVGFLHIHALHLATLFKNTKKTWKNKKKTLKNVKKRNLNKKSKKRLLHLQGGPKKLRQIFLAITLVNMDRF